MTERLPSVLVLEDEALLAIELSYLLTEEGFQVEGPASNVAVALDLIGKHSIDLAVLDVNLRGTSSSAVADRLADLEIPFVFLSGHTREYLPERHRGRPLVEKPFAEAQLLTAIGTLIA